MICGEIVKMFEIFIGYGLICFLAGVVVGMILLKVLGDEWE